MFPKILLICAILLLTGCQSGQVFGTRATPTPAEEVVAEGVMNCPISNFREFPNLAKIDHPEHGKTDAGFVVFWDLTCPVPYLKGSSVAIQDGYTAEDGTYHWTGLVETVTAEGGIWHGTSDNNSSTSRSIHKGEGKYQGLQMVTEYNMATMDVKYRVTKLVDE